MPRATKDQWEQARAKWESDPKETFESIAQLIGVSRPAVSKRAEKEGWARSQTLAEISERAHLKADKVTAKVTPETKAKAEAAAVDERVEVLVMQRNDWAEHRAVFSTKANVDDKYARHAKIVAEMLLLRHKGEREAYGITGADDGNKAAVTVNITRFSGA